jgi:hypothetical protein
MTSGDDEKMTRAQRTTKARIAAHTSWAKTPDRARRTAPAREAAHSRFERIVDPHEVMEPEQRAKAADSARAAHYRSMALKSHEARRRNAS